MNGARTGTPIDADVYSAIAAMSREINPGWELSSVDEINGAIETTLVVPCCGGCAHHGEIVVIGMRADGVRAGGYWPIAFLKSLVEAKRLMSVKTLAN